MRKEPLQFYVDKLKKNEYFSLSRFGDGELYCMWGQGTKNSNGCHYTPKLRDALIDSLNHKEENFLFGLQRVLPRDVKRLDSFLKDRNISIEWYDSEIFGDELVGGRLFPLIDQLKKMNVVIISNNSIRPIKDIINYDLFIEVPSFDAFEHRERVLDTIKSYNKPAVYLFSCGMAACSFVSDLHGIIKDSWFIDIGHIWDPFVGNMSRCNLENLTKEDIIKNLSEEIEQQ